MSKDNSCPAFPFQIDHNTANTEYCYGMTLRDYFAAKAINGLLSHGVQRNETSEPAQSNWYAETAYQIADAMLAERAR